MEFKLRKISLVAAMLLLMMTINGNAAGAKRGYGMAGCGLGALALGDEPGKIQILAATLNNLVSPQTSAISTGTSNCTDYSGDVAESLYIDGNREALKVDVSRGHGETLAALLNLYGCSANGTVGSQLQNNYGVIFNSNAQMLPAADINSSIKSVIRSSDNRCASHI